MWLLSSPFFAASAAASSCAVASTVMVKIEWEREESWFMRVAPVERFFLPTCTITPATTHATLNAINTTPQ
jgi:hypothetical protein